MRPDLAHIKAKVLPAKIPTQRRFVESYVALLSGLLRLTDTELSVLVELVWKIYNGTPQDEVFSPEGRKSVRESLKKKMSPQNFNNYLMNLKNKGAIIHKEDIYFINPYLHPREELTFRYYVQEKFNPDI